MAVLTAPAPVEIKPSLAGTAISLTPRVEVYPSSPMPEFNTDSAIAFAARLKSDASSDLIALVCNSGLPPRLEVINSMRSVAHTSVMRMIDNGVISWPDGGQYPTIVYQRPSAPRFMHNLDETHATMSEDAITRRFIQPLAGVLIEFLRTGVVHGAIRPTNLFWRMTGGGPPQLGDCLTSPAGLSQPTLFETIERGMTMPMGRGPGTHSDDCYAFGVMLALFVLGQNPVKGMDEASVVRAKIEHGTFNTIVGHHRLAPVHIELLRGLLSDDAHQRWTAADLEQWLTGRRLTPKSSDIGRRGSRHFEFNGKEYWQVRPIAIAMAAHITEAVQVIENNALDKWLRRSLADDDRADSVADAVASARESGKTAHFEEQLVARVCMTLDPTAPIRYRGMAVMPLGISTMLSHAMLTGSGPDTLADIISSQMVTFWVDAQERKTDLVPLMQQYERLATIIEKTTYGNGLERVLYELNPSLPCLSSMLRSYCVLSGKTMLPALEKAASSPNRSRDPMDRHIAAFLIVRDRRSELLMEAMSASEGSMRKGLAMLSLYSEMQSRHGPETLPQLAQWLLPSLEAATRRFFGKGLRENMQKQLKDAVDKGNLSVLGKLIDNPVRAERDEQDFIAARLLYLNILKEINALEGRMARREAIVQEIGKPAAAAISGIVAMFAVLFAVGRAMWGM